MVKYVTSPDLETANISFLMQLELFFKIGYVCKISKEFWDGAGPYSVSLQSKYCVMILLAVVRWTIILPQKHTQR